MIFTARTKQHEYHLQKKWQNLREYLRKCLRAEKTRTGQAATERPLWEYLEKMEFLRDTLAYSRTGLNLFSNDSSCPQFKEESRGQKRRKSLAKEKDILFCEYLKKKNEDSSQKEKKFPKISFEGI